MSGAALCGAEAPQSTHTAACQVMCWCAATPAVLFWIPPSGSPTDQVDGCNNSDLQVVSVGALASASPAGWTLMWCRLHNVCVGGLGCVPRSEALTIDRDPFRSNYQYCVDAQTVSGFLGRAVAVGR